MTDDKNAEAVAYGRALAEGIRKMFNVHNIEDDMAFVCDCGSASFNLVKSGHIECARCHVTFGEWSK